MTPEQQKALALARARRRRAESQGSGQSFRNDGTVGPTYARGGKDLPGAGAAPMDASTVFTDEMLFGLPGKASAGLNALLQRGIAALPGESPFEGKGVSELYDANRGAYNQGREQYAEEHPVANTAATIGGQFFGAGKLAPASFTRLVPQAANPLLRFAGMTAASGVDGAAMGALSAYGHDQDIGTGALTGGALGLAAYPAVQALASGARTVGSMVGIGNQGRAQNAVAELLARSGKTPDAIGDDLIRAAADGQGVYTVADALGNPGQRALSGIARSPGDTRRIIAETLDARQAGQGRRISNALSEGFDAADTSAQRAVALKAERNSQAEVNYGAAGAGAGTVDPSEAIRAADDFLTPGASGLLNPATNIADDSIEAAVRRARSYLTDGKSVLSDFNAAFRAKLELDAMIEGAKPAVQRQLIPIRNSLDSSLEAASSKYASARDTFRQQSKAIEAIDTGRNAAMRGRVEDTIPAFNAMTPEQQAAFRAGYVDPLIAQTQGAATGVNKARPLINDATNAEFPVFAAPGKGQQLMDRIAREQTMFDTRAAALGGSRTADNLADMAETASIDPTMIGNLLSGRWGSFVGDVVRSGSNVLSGRNEAVRDKIAMMLLERNPQVAKEAVAQSLTKQGRSKEINEAIVRAILGMSVPAGNEALN